jgi:hypothetical protein
MRRRKRRRKEEEEEEDKKDYNEEESSNYWLNPYHMSGALHILLCLFVVNRRKSRLRGTCTNILSLENGEIRIQIQVHIIPKLMFYHHTTELCKQTRRVVLPHGAVLMWDALSLATWKELLKGNLWYSKHDGKPGALNSLFWETLSHPLKSKDKSSKSAWNPTAQFHTSSHTLPRSVLFLLNIILALS